MTPKEIKQILTEYFKVVPITTEIYRKARTINGTDWFRLSAIQKCERLSKIGKHTDKSILDFLMEDIFIHPNYETCLAAAKEHRGYFRNWNLFEIEEFQSSLGKVWIIWD